MLLSLLHVFSATALAGDTPGYTADDTAYTVDSKGNVQVECVVAASEAEVRALLADTQAVARLTPQILSVKTLTRGTCDTLGVTVKGAWDPLTYTAERCPTARGYKYTLLESDSITDYEAEWRFDAAPGGGTKVTYRVRTDVDLPFPSALIRKGVIDSAKETIESFVRRVGSRK